MARGSRPPRLREMRIASTPRLGGPRNADPVVGLVRVSRLPPDAGHVTFDAALSRVDGTDGLAGAAAGEALVFVGGGGLPGILVRIVASHAAKCSSTGCVKTALLQSSRLEAVPTRVVRPTSESLWFGNAVTPT